MSIEVVIRDIKGDRWLQGTTPRQIMTAATMDQVMPALQQTEDWVNHQGGVAVGFITYEASTAFDPVLHTQPSQSPLPLLFFALFDRLTPPPPPPDRPRPVLHPHPMAARHQ